jgi:hypothetical protein
MSLINQFKQPIHREDIMPVIRQGIFMSMITGILMGAIKLFIFVVFEIEFSFLLVLLVAYFISKRIKQSYHEYHIWYSVIAILSFVFGFYLMNITYYFGFFFIQRIDNLPMEYIRMLLNPSFTFYFLNPFSGFFFELEVILQFIFFMIGAFYAFIASR